MRAGAFKSIQVSRLGLTGSVVLAAFSASCAGSCSREAAPPPAATTNESERADWAIHIFAAGKRVDIPVAAEGAAGSVGNGAIQPTGLWNAEIGQEHGDQPAKLPRTAADSNNGPNTPAAKTKDVTVSTPDGGATLSDNPSAFDGWSLVGGAAEECGLPADSMNFGGVGPAITASVPPWKPDTFFIFSRIPVSCDEVLHDQQVLLCIADKLDEIATTVAPITWSHIPATASIPGPWVIPPQATRDRFIARDLAINVLANMAVLDMQVPVGIAKTCSDAYSYATKDNAWAITHQDALFPTGGRHLNEDPNRIGATSVGDITSANAATTIPPAVTYRLGLETHLLRSGSRLLNELIRQSVIDDLAGAERRRARATDPVRGAHIVWGGVASSPDGGDGSYNSLAHAIRVLEGRWEMGPNSPDPKCGGLGAMQLLRAAYGSDLTAREQDKEVTTGSQREAIAAVESAGVVVSDDKANDPGTTGSVLKAAVAGQLKVKAQPFQGDGRVGISDPLPTLWDRTSRSVAMAIAGAGPAQALTDDVAVRDLRAVRAEVSHQRDGASHDGARSLG